MKTERKISDHEECERLVPLGFWLNLATRAGVPHIPAIFSPPFPVDEIFRMLDGEEAPGLCAAFIWLKNALYSFVDEGRLPMVRWECCCDDDGKLRASKGEGWSAAWTKTTPDSPRVVDCTVGEATRLCVRPWVHALRQAGYPVELRVFYGPEGYQGVSNYYPQRPLRKSLLILEAVRRARAAARLMAANLLGLDEVPVDRQDYATEAEEWADLVADNRLSELSEWDNPALKDLLQELDTGLLEALGADMELTGYTERAMADLMSQFHVGEEVKEVEAPEPPKQAVSRRGDIWLCGNHRVMCGDSINAEDVQALIRGKKMQACITDPPYNVGKDLEKGVEWDERPPAEYEQFTMGWFRIARDICESMIFTAGTGKALANLEM